MTRYAWFACVLAACGDNGDGQVRVTAYGELFIENGIPAEEMGDQWSVTFDRFEVKIDRIVVGGVTMPEAGPVDLSVSTGGQGHLIATANVPEGSHSSARFAIARIDLRGSATKDNAIKTFSWSFDQPTEYTNCESTTSVIDSERAATFEITIHADHLFYDSLVAEEPQVLFQALADADTDLDGEITQEELQAAGIGGYDPGNQDIADLWSWLVAQYHTVGHVDGEGHCDAAKPG